MKSTKHPGYNILSAEIGTPLNTLDLTVRCVQCKATWICVLHMGDNSPHTLVCPNCGDS